MSQSEEWSEVIAALESAIEINKMMTAHLRLYGMKAEKELTAKNKITAEAKKVLNHYAINKQNFEGPSVSTGEMARRFLAKIEEMEEDGEKLTFDDIAGPTKDGLLASYRTEFETALTNLREKLENGGGDNG